MSDTLSPNSSSSTALTPEKKRKRRKNSSGSTHGTTNSHRRTASKPSAELVNNVKKTINEIFINSEGWRLIINKFIHRFDPEAVIPNKWTAKSNINTMK